MKTHKYWSSNVPMSFLDKPLTYEEKREFRYGLQDYMHEVFNFGHYVGKLVLDLGCGSGIDSCEFAKLGASVVSIDFTQTSTQLTRDLFHEAKLDGDVVRCDARFLPFKREIFDCVYSFGVIHHVPDIEKTLHEIHRVLKVDADFSFMVYNRDSLLYAYSIVLRGMQQNLTPSESLSKYSERVEECPYVMTFTEEEIRRILEPHFDVTKILIRYNVIDLLNERKIKFQLEKEAELGWHLIVKAKKKLQ